MPGTVANNRLADKVLALDEIVVEFDGFRCDIKAFGNTR